MRNETGRNAKDKLGREPKSKKLYVRPDLVKKAKLIEVAGGGPPPPT